MKIIAFDIGNVCLKINVEKCLAALELEMDTWLPPKLLAATDAMEKGKISESEWLATFSKSTNGAFSEKVLKNAYNEIIGEEIRETCEFAEMAAASGYRLVFFSDTSEIHLDHVFAKLSFAHLVTGGVYSFEVGSKKPDTAIFAEFEKRYGIPSLYLDDKQENINAGVVRGWPSLKFESGKMSAEELYVMIK